VARKGRGKGGKWKGRVRIFRFRRFPSIFFLDSIKPVRFGPVQSVLSFFKPEPNLIGWFFYFLIGLFNFFYRFCFSG